MAVIPLSDTVDARSVRGDRLGTAPSEMMSGPGQALKGLGDVITQAVERHNADQQKMNQYNANVALERWSTEQTVAYNQDIQNGNPDGSDFIANREKALLDSYNKVRGTISDDETKKHADLVFERFRGNQMVAGFSDVEKKRTGYVKDTTEKSIDDTINSGAIKSDTDYNLYYKSVIEPRINEYVKDPGQNAAMRELFGKKMAGAFLDMNPTYAAPKRHPVVTTTPKEKISGLRDAIITESAKYGFNPLDVATLMSYETSGTFDDWKAGPTTKWGQHRGLIQWGEPQRKQYGVYQGMPVGEQVAASMKYLHDRGVRPGMSRTQMYAAINGGDVSKVNASDAAAGGAPGTVAEKVATQMAGHEAKAQALLGGNFTPSPSVSYVSTPVQKPTGGMWDYVDYGQWQAFQNRAEAEQKSQMASFRADLNNTLDDYYTNLKIGGASDLREPDIQDFREAYGEEGDAQFKQHLLNKQLALDENSLGDKSTGQIMALIEQRRNEMSTGEGGAADAKRMAELLQETNPILQERAKKIAAQEAEQRGQFEGAEKERIKSLKGKIDSFEADVVTVAGSGKTYNGWSPSLKDYTDVYGEEAGSLLFSNTGAMIAAAKDASKFGTSSMKDIQTSLETYRNDIKSGAGAAEAEKRFNAMQQAAANTMAAREKDIAGYVQLRYPAIQKVFEEYQRTRDPAVLSKGYQMMNEIQDGLGVPPEKRKLLTNDVAKSAVDEFFNVEQPVDDRISSITGIVFSGGAQGFNRQILDQLIEAGLPRGSVSALAAYERGDSQAARRLFDASMVKKEAERIVKLSEADKVARDSIIMAEMASPSSRGHTMYNLYGGADADLAQFGADKDVIERSVDIRMGMGQDVTTATNGAIRDLFGDTMRTSGVTSSGASYDVIVPNDMDTKSMASGFDALYVQVQALIDATAQQETERAINSIDGAQAQSAARLAIETRTKLASRDILTNGFFKSVDDKFGFVNPYTGKLLAGPDGKQLLFSVDDVLNAAAATGNKPQQRGFGRFGEYGLRQPNRGAVLP